MNPPQSVGVSERSVTETAGGHPFLAASGGPIPRIPACGRRLASLPARPVIALINTSDDNITLLSALCTSEDVQPVTGFIPALCVQRGQYVAWSGAAH